METNPWTRFVKFVKDCFEEKFSTAFKGSILGLFGSLHLFWSGAITSSVVIYVLKSVGTLLLTAGTTLTTCYVSYKFDKWKDNDKQKKRQGEKNKNKAA